MSTAIWWVRRDLRLADNQALHAAMQHADEVLPMFILDDRLLESEWVGEKRIAFMLGGLKSLDQSLRERGSILIIRHGNPREELARLMEETGATGIFAEEDYSPFARKRDEEINASLPLTLVHGLIGHPPGTIRKSDGDPYVVYTPFMKQWKTLAYPTKADLLTAPGHIHTPEHIQPLPIPDAPYLPSAVPFTPGEVAALEALKNFVMGDAPVYHYKQDRNRADLYGTSMLSPYIRWGMVSIRRCIVAARFAIDNAPDKTTMENAATWLNELIWRDFYYHILYFFPEARTGNYNSSYDGIQWRNNKEEFAAWREGRTGYPIVDAAMRQLVTLGWMHNRCRMIVASFLTKDLLIDWRWGEKFFMQHLVDGDAASNNGGWQWAAGTGTDAQPYFRIFNPTSQAETHDPEGAYIRQWLPELQNVPDQYIHQPHTMPEDVQEEAGCIIGTDYPAPIVDHKTARKTTLEVYKAAREN